MRPSFTFLDLPQMPGSGFSAESVYRSAVPLSGTAGQAYVERRGIPLPIPASCGIRFDPSFGGRPAVIVALRDLEGNLTSVHGRYLHTARGQSKMLTVGVSGGAICLSGAPQTQPIIVVEGLFDALSLAVCGWEAIATIGRPVPWLAEVAADSTVWAAFDNGKSGELNFHSYRSGLREADVRRLPPPERCKDWNTALMKLGAQRVSKWVSDRITAQEEA